MNGITFKTPPNSALAAASELSPGDVFLPLFDLDNTGHEPLQVAEWKQPSGFGEGLPDRTVRGYVGLRTGMLRFHKHMDDDFFVFGTAADFGSSAADEPRAARYWSWDGTKGLWTKALIKHIGGLGAFDHVFVDVLTGRGVLPGEAPDAERSWVDVELTLMIKGTPGIPLFRGVR